MIKGNYKKLGEVCDFVGGSQPPKSNFVYDLNGLDSEQYVRLIQIRDYKSNNHIVYVHRSMAKKFCSKDDVMIGRYGPPLFQILRGLEGAYNVALMKAVPKKTDQLDQNYLFLFLQSPDVQGYVINLSERAAGQTGVNKPALYNYPILLPPIAEQKRIVAMLDAAFADIEKIRANTEQNLINARELFESYLHNVFSQHGDGWCNSKLGTVCEVIQRGISPKYINDGGLCVVNQKCVRDHNINYDLTRRHNIELKNVKENRYIKIGDVLVNSTGTGTLGRVAQVRNEPDEPTTVDTHVTIVRPLAGKFYDDFFGYMLIKIEDEIALSGEGASGQTELSRSTLKNNFNVSYPIDKKQQKIIVEELDMVKQYVSMLEKAYSKKLSELDNLKKSLLHQAFSGQLTNQEVIA
jgi:type I restriction enzyme S subunit